MTVLRSLAVVALAMALTSCSAAKSTGSSETTATYAEMAAITTTSSGATTSSVTTTSSGATASSVATASSGDTTSPEFSVETAMANLGEFATGWNDNNLRWTTAVSDPAESYEDFLVVQQEVGVDQGSLLADLDLWVGTLEPELRPALEPLLENYRNRYRHMLDELFPATLGTDNVAFQAALLKYQSDSLPESSEAAVRSFFAHPVVAAALRSEGVDPEAMVDSLMRTLAAS